MLRVVTQRVVIDAEHKEVAEAALELFGPDGLERVFPLAPVQLRLELRGVPTAVAHALQRVMTDELRGHRLEIGPGGFKLGESTDLFMSEHFVRSRLQLVPLRPQISEALLKEARFQLRVDNPGFSVKTVYAGDLVATGAPIAEPLFNPSFELGFLQPGRTLVVEDIGVGVGTGSQHASYNVAVRGAIKHLDLEELPREETHAKGGKAAALSGYRESSLVANPRHHLVSVVIPATPRSPTARLI